jgi:hypothetical protein
MAEKQAPSKLDSWKGAWNVLLNLLNAADAVLHVWYAVLLLLVISQ